MIYGRPQMLRPSSTRSFIHNLPSKTDEELADQREASTNGPRKTDFFVHSLKLIHYLGDILDSLHGQDPDPAAHDGRAEDSEVSQRTIGNAQFQRMLKLDATLVKWRRELPPHLKAQHKLPDLIFWRQAQVLNARYGFGISSLSPISILIQGLQISAHADLSPSPGITCSAAT